MLLKRLINMFPLAGLLIAAWGVYGLVLPIGQATDTGAQDDPSLQAKGFDLPAPTSELDFKRSWVKVDVAETGASSATPTVALTTPTAAPRSLAKISEPEDAPAVPDRIVIPAIKLDAPVVTAPIRKLTLQQQVFEQWLAPDAFAAGWHTGSAWLGRPGNTVLNGHHNVFGKVFGKLVDLQSGDEIIVYSGNQVFHYVVAQSMILKERDATLSERETNAQWILPSDDERLTLVTCWPPESNSHRLLIIASPIK